MGAGDLGRRLRERGAGNSSIYAKDVEVDDTVSDAFGAVKAARAHEAEQGDAWSYVVAWSVATEDNRMCEWMMEAANLRDGHAGDGTGGGALPPRHVALRQTASLSTAIQVDCSDDGRQVAAWHKRPWDRHQRIVGTASSQPKSAGT